MKDNNDSLSPQYEASLVEDSIYSMWEEKGLFKPDLSRKESFCISMPPPNATGTLHLGHATMLAFEDVMVRYNRMLEKATLWLPGTDHAAIATQSVVERKLQSQGMAKPREELGREGLINQIKEFVEISKGTIRNQIRKMGSSCDWSREKYTLDEDLSKSVNAFFKAMYEDGLIYRGDRIVNWDPNMKTTVADDEIEYVEEKGKFYYFQYGPVVIGTARPETKFLDKVIVVHPEDKRYKKLIGKEFDVEWIEGKIKARVISDSCIDMEFGTGAMTITPAHSMVDFDLAKIHDLEIRQIIDFDGKIRKDVSKEFGGMEISKAREKIVRKLEEKGLLHSIDEKYLHKKSVNYRGKGVIEPQVMKQWFIDVNKKTISWKGKERSLKEVLQDTVRSKMINIMPDRFEKTYFHWIDNLRDWCISRQIWWGHSIPVWYRLTEERYKKFTSYKDVSSYTLALIGGEEEIVYSEEKPTADGFWVRDPDTLDTWFSSALWTFSTLGWPEKTVDFKKFHPTTVLETGYDILFFWVARMILASTYALRRDGLKEEDCLPFKNVFLHGLIRDKFGKKMSKSKPETCIDPLDMIKKYGADALRLSLLIGSSPGNDMRLYEEKIAGYRNFINKIWNISRYVLMSTEVVNSEPIPVTNADFWILSKLNEVIKDVTKGLDSYNFSLAGEKVYNFLWNEFADWYLEVAKIEGNKDTILRHILKNSLKLLHPFVPFITEYIWKISDFTKRELISEKWPTTLKVVGKKAFMGTIDLISAIRSERSYFHIEPKEFVNVVIRRGTIKDEQIVKKLARIKEVKTDTNYSPEKGDVLVTTKTCDIYLSLGNVIDIDAEISRLNKNLEEANKGIIGYESKLNNSEFVKNAPAEVVKTNMEKRDELLQSISKIKQKIEQLNLKNNE